MQQFYKTVATLVIVCKNISLTQFATHVCIMMKHEVKHKCLYHQYVAFTCTYLNVITFVSWSDELLHGIIMSRICNKLLRSPKIL